MQPRAFISYSWTSAEHVQWVVSLATELMESGVEIILDKWDLREGQDKYHFMESMVRDATVTKVIVIADCEYSRKANERVGGVGTESQVISKEVYDSVDQRKFVAVLKEYDIEGRPCLPAFFTSRIYIDMSDDLKRRDNFEQLVRWLFDKPQFEKPSLGHPPQYITSPSSISLGTSSRARHAVAAIRAGAPNAPGALRDYLDGLAAALVNRHLDIPAGNLPGDGMIVVLEMLLPARDEFVDVAFSVARYRDDAATFDAFCDLFEAMLGDGALSDVSSTADDERADVIRYLTYEFVLYFLAALLKHNRFGQARLFFQREYVRPPTSRRPGGLSDFQDLQQRPQALLRRGEQRQRRFVYEVAELVRDRATRTDLTLTDVAQADFVAFLYSRVNCMEAWRPHAALYAPNYQPLPLFLRASSARVFADVATLFGVADVADLREKLRKNIDTPWARHWEGLEIETLMNDRALSARP
ncbi:MAG: SEFIR domain-containing protein [Thermoanaerobaculia bacterium]